MATSDQNTLGSFSFNAKPLGKSTPSQSHSQGRFFMAQITLRVLALTFTVAAIPMMVTAHQPISLLGMSITPSYSQSSAMKFLLAADATVCAFSVLSLFFVWLLNHSGSRTGNYFCLFLHDMVMTVLIISGCAAATTVGYLSRYGQPATFWNPVCNVVDKFCHQLLISTILSYLAFFCYLALTIISAYKLTCPST